MENTDNKLIALRHSTEHILMQAMENLYPNILKAMGPAIENGFYFDFELAEKISEKDFPKIEKEMQKIIKEDLPITHKEIKIEEARKLFKNNPYKNEWLDEIESKKETPTMYLTGDKFIDLCKGPHLKSTGQVKAFKLLSVAGAYWHGDEKNKMLTRIYGTAFPTQKELDTYLNILEETKKRDHKKIGRELKLFMFHETAPGEPYWLENGLIIFNELLDFWRVEHKNKGYREISSPLVNKKELWEISGHWEHYKEDMFIADMGKNDIYGIKPMNCPNAMVVFASETRSYKDLPFRLSDSDMLHRYERSGTLNGLFRARSFRQDDSHNFVTEEQIKNEYSEILDIAEKFYGVFNLPYNLRLGTRPKKYLGDIQTWDKAENDLRTILDEKVGKGKYKVLEGDGAFYGPKIDILMLDSMGREWQMGTIQLDFQLPRRFNLKYIEKDGSEKTPVVIHRVIYGSIERFIGILTEHFNGAFPVWLSPVQAQIIPISENHINYAKEVSKKLLASNIRTNIDERSETMQSKIRDAQLQKIPYMLILGDREMASETVSIRLRDQKSFSAIKVEEFINKTKKIIESKSLELW
ncbi:MAG: threonine--tRNA ligase [bacterium]